MITLDIKAAVLSEVGFLTNRSFEIAVSCRHCSRLSLMHVRSKRVPTSDDIVTSDGFMKIANDIHSFYEFEKSITIADTLTEAAPAHLPPEIERSFTEGVKCLSIGCFNAAGAMFRLCLDLATKTKLPDSDTDGLTSHVRDRLALRLKWLFDNNHLPASLCALSKTIKDYGNDAAHDGTLTKEDAEDIYDFTKALLENLYTQPQRIKDAEIRRKKRRALNQ